MAHRLRNTGVNQRKQQFLKKLFFILFQYAINFSFQLHQHTNLNPYPHFFKTFHRWIMLFCWIMLTGSTEQTKRSTCQMTSTNCPILQQNVNYINRSVFSRWTSDGHQAVLLQNSAFLLQEIKHS